MIGVQCYTKNTVIVKDARSTKLMENVKIIYKTLLAQGYTKKDAAKEAQARTGMSVVTNRPIDRRYKETKESIYVGQYLAPKK